jgi:hypothetical protein
VPMLCKLLRWQVWWRISVANVLGSDQF